MTTPPFRPPAPGEVLAGKYAVERVLGVGGMGVVVAAHHLQLDERVALKFLLPETTLSADAVKRFVREARAAVKIKSDHVARVSDVGTLENGLPYLVMEYLEGADLASELERRGAFGADEAVELVLQACEAIAEAHALGIVHRDLKPANLFLTRRAGGVPWIKVLDFGISKISGGADVDMTRTFAVMGSPLYMSPEQIRASKSVDVRADIWALGVILYELLSSRVPFQGEALPELSVNIAIEPPLPFPPNSPVPPALQTAVFRCLEKDRERRYASVTELAQALAPFANQRALPSIERIRAVGASGTPWPSSAPRDAVPSGVPSTSPTLTIAPRPEPSGGTGAAFGGTSVVEARTASGTGLGRPVAVTLAVVGAIAAAAAVFWLRSNAAVPTSTPDAVASATPNQAPISASRASQPGAAEQRASPDTAPEPAFLPDDAVNAPSGTPSAKAANLVAPTPPPTAPLPASVHPKRQSPKRVSAAQPATAPAPAATPTAEPRPAATAVDVFSNRKFD
jgi:serine/threonine-protein kinase